MPRSVFFGLLLSVAAVLASGPAPPAKDDAESELICHTSDAADCYPKVFQPSKEFRVVRRDQDIPAGLHVRLDMQTGEREAKLNDADEKHPDLEGLPVERSVLLVDPAPGLEAERPIPAGAPKYDPVGKVKEQTGPEAHRFHHALTRLKEDGHGGNGTGAAFDDALEQLRELSHDMYYGSVIAQDLDALRSLFCAMSTADVSDRGTGSSVIITRAVGAAATISASLQNNAVALKSAEKHWPALMNTACTGHSKPTVLDRLILAGIRPSSSMVAETVAIRDPGPALVKARLSALGGLLKSPEIRKYFLANDGMRELLRVLVVKDPAFVDAQVRAANLVVDTFFDENMGAVSGQWPTKAASSAAHCEEDGDGLGDECWDYHIARAAAESGSDPDHWSNGLLSMLRVHAEVNKLGSRHRVYREL